MSPLANGPLESLCGLMTFLTTVKEPDDDRVWARAADKIAAAVGCEAATYFVFIPKPGQLVARYALGSAGDRIKSQLIETGKGLCGWVAMYREPLVVDDAYADQRFSKDLDRETGFKTRNVMAVPLFDRMELVGVLEFLNKRGGAFDESDLSLATAASQAVSMSLRALRLEGTVDRVTAHNASILENLGGGFLAVDIHGRVMLCNPAAKRILGLPDDLSLNKPVDQTLMAIPAMAELLMDTLVKKETVKRQDLRWKLKGETRVLGYSTLLIQDPRGQIVGAGITFQDITQFQKK